MYGVVPGPWVTGPILQAEDEQGQAVRLGTEGDEMRDDIGPRMEAILRNFDGSDPAATAAAIEALWLEFEPQDLGGIKAEDKARHKMVGTPIPVLRAMGKPLKAAAGKGVDEHLPLARVLWDEYGREGRNLALMALGGMELTRPDTVVPLLFEMCPSCVTWEDADRMAMDALEPIVRRRPDEWLAPLRDWLDDPDRWRRRVAVTVVGRLPMKHPRTAARCLAMIEGLLADTREEVRKATSFAIRLVARCDAELVAAFLERHVPPTDAAATWVLCDATRRMGRALLPAFSSLLPSYEAWLANPHVPRKDVRSIRSALKTLRAVS